MTKPYILILPDNIDASLNIYLLQLSIIQPPLVILLFTNSFVQNK